MQRFGPMILLVVGTQLPFDRLVMPIDAWAQRNPQVRVIAQIGQSTYVPRALTAFPFIAPQELRAYQQEAELCIAHAGMGSILSALEFRKPLVIMPRDHTRGEHRNGHQFATARRVAGTPGVHVAETEAELISLLDRRAELQPPAALGQASPQLLGRISAFLADDDVARVNFLDPARSGR